MLPHIHEQLRATGATVGDTPPRRSDGRVQRASGTGVLRVGLRSGSRSGLESGFSLRSEALSFYLGTPKNMLNDKCVVMIKHVKTQRILLVSDAYGPYGCLERDSFRWPSAPSWSARSARETTFPLTTARTDVTACEGAVKEDVLHRRRMRMIQTSIFGNPFKSCLCVHVCVSCVFQYSNPVRYLATRSLVQHISCLFMCLFLCVCVSEAGNDWLDHRNERPKGLRQKPGLQTRRPKNRA